MLAALMLVTADLVTADLVTAAHQLNAGELRMLLQVVGRARE